MGSPTSSPEILLEFSSITCVVEGRATPILNAIAGKVYAREVAALMGPSGAGKTTLLHILANQEVHGKVSGQKMLGCQPDKVGFVNQQDIFEPYMTTQETLIMYAELMLPVHLETKVRAEKIQSVAGELGLTEVLDLLVGGNDFSGGEKTLSGGQKRRLSIGCTMLTDPKLVFLDEPTTGLDSGTAMEVVNIFSRLKACGQGLICSIHQPRYDIFKQFDQCYFLAAGVLVARGHNTDVYNFYKTIFPEQQLREYTILTLYNDLVENVCSATLLVVTWSYISGLRTGGDHIVRLWFTYLLTALTSVSFTYPIIYSFENPSVVIAINSGDWIGEMGAASGALAFLSAYCGSYVNIDHLEPFVSWIPLANPFYYSLSAAMQNQFEGSDYAETSDMEPYFDYGKGTCLMLTFLFL
eukprot:gene12780-15107_t